MKGKIKRLFLLLAAGLDRIIHRNVNEFVVISNNCWGAEIYRRLGISYNTPFVGLFIYGPDYLKLLNNFEHYTSQDLEFRSNSKWTQKKINYPIGVLKDIEIHFMHYKNEEEATIKWYRRMERLKKVHDPDKFFYKICDRDLTSKEIIESFHKLSLKNKISFSSFSLPLKNHFIVSPKSGETTVPDGVTLYKVSYQFFDVLYWVKTGILKTNMYTKIKTLLKLN